MRGRFGFKTNLFCCEIIPPRAMRSCAFIMTGAVICVFVFVLFSPCVSASSDIDNLYCGAENCYEILGATIDSAKEEISRSYRQLARKWHPDVYKGDLSKEDAVKQFQKIANAYEILSDEEMRADYNYLLENPEAYYEHYYRFYRHRLAPHVDWRIVVTGFILIVTAGQYAYWYHAYWEMIRRVGAIPRFRVQALHLAKEKNITLPESEDQEEKTKDKSELKRRAKEVEDKLVTHVLAICPGDVDLGLVTLLRPAKFENTLLVQLVYLPVTIWRKVSLYIRLFVAHKFFNRPLSDEDKVELIRLNLGLPADAWKHYDDNVKEDYLELELWRPDKFAEWRAEQEAESRRKLATQSGRYRQAKRWERNHAGDRMCFED